MNKSSKRYKVVKRRGKEISLVVGEDLHFDHILDLTGKSMVGKFSRIRVGKELIHRWIMETWNPISRYWLTFHILGYRWLCFLFNSQWDVDRILKGSWFLYRTIITIKPWYPLFDAKEEFA